jgi:hypothetical protein
MVSVVSCSCSQGGDTARIAMLLLAHSPGGILTMVHKIWVGVGLLGFGGSSITGIGEYVDALLSIVLYLVCNVCVLAVISAHSGDRCVFYAYNVTELHTDAGVAFRP